MASMMNVGHRALADWGFRFLTIPENAAVLDCGFSSGGALALGMAAHNSALGTPLSQPRHIVAVSPGEVPWNDAERLRMQALNSRDVAIDYAFMAKGEKLMRHGRDDVPDYMLAPSLGDYTGVGDIHLITAPMRCSTARCRSSRTPASGRTFPIRSRPARK